MNSKRGWTWALLALGLGTVCLALKPEADAGAAESREGAPPSPPPQLPGQRLSSLREVLEMLGIDASQFERLVDGRPLDPEEEETLYKILYQLPRLGRGKLQAWQKAGISWDEVAAQPAAHRMDVFSLRGRVHGIRVTELAPEAASRLEFGRFYRVAMTLADDPHAVEVCCREIPKAWLDRQTLDERAACLGTLLKTGDSVAGRPQLVFAAERIAWLPDRPDPDVGITADQVLLADQGVDAGLYDAIRSNNGKALLSADRECFFQMLAAVARLEPDPLFGQTTRRFDLPTLLSQPETRQFQLRTFRGVVRRVQKILVEEEDLRLRFGIDHYYQLDVFVDLGDQELRIVQGRDASKAALFRNRYLVPCCVLRLPPGLPEREDLSQQVDIAGFFFKLWAFKSDYVQAIDTSQRQLGPLFIATTPRLVEPPPIYDPFWGWVTGVTILCVLVGVFFAVWRTSRKDREIAKAARHRRLSTETLIPPS